MLPRKVAALKAHVSQTSHMDIESSLREWGQGMARQGGLPDGSVAEAFKVLDTA